MSFNLPKILVTLKALITLLKSLLKSLLRLNSLQKSILQIFSIVWVACTMTVPSHATTVYKTIGDFGEVKYSQFPPHNNVKAEIIELRSNGRPMQSGKMEDTTVSTQPATYASKEKQRIKQLEQQMQHQQNLEITKRCQSLYENLRNLNTGDRIYEPDGKGGRHYLEKRDIELKQENVQKMIGQYCDE